MKSFKPTDGPNGTSRGRKRKEPGNKLSRREAIERNAHLDHRSEAKLYRKGPGKEATLCFMGHALMENRNGLIVDAGLMPADGHAERVAALHMIEPCADRPHTATCAPTKLMTPRTSPTNCAR